MNEQISSIMNDVIDPRPEIQIKAVLSLVRSPAVLAKVKTWILIQEGYGGYTREEIALKWERRIMRLIRKAVAKQTVKRVTYKIEDGGYVIYLDGKAFSGVFDDLKGLIPAARLLLRGLMDGLTGDQVAQIGNWEGFKYE